MKKSTRHSKITGDFAEGLVMYWLSKYGHECARVDHTGIDLIARDPGTNVLMGISVKCRSRYEGMEKRYVNLPSDGFVKARAACKAFGCVPYYAIVIDASPLLRCFVLPLDELELIAGGTVNRTRTWSMTPKHVDSYISNPKIKIFTLQTMSCSWRAKELEPLAEC